MHHLNSSNLESIDSMQLKKSRFTEMLILENSLEPAEFDSWAFCRGMLFNSPDKWWGDHGLRDFPHEGIDLCLYVDRSRVIQRLDEKTRIPVMHDGVVRAMFKDYLGQAVIIEHEDTANQTRTFLSVYAHTRPLAGIEVGTGLKEGDVIATIADTSHSKANILPHLHFSLGIPSNSLSYEGFVWNMMRDPVLVKLKDPLAVIDWPHQALNASNTPCRDI
jgi:murein DD-endopeptidase MepM/ murein hydrolase activator NlpD